jgi:glycerophosphoryl diester phosphodiesterase
VVAHRGDSLRHPENTLPAFDAAVETGADLVEFDVRRTADGHLVISHDSDVARTTDGAGDVCDLTLDELRRFRNGVGPAAPGIPTLAEALDLLVGRIGVDIEIKNIPGDPDFDSPREAVAEEVVKVLDRFSSRNGILVSSFNWLSIERIRALAPDVTTGFLTSAAIDPRAALAYVRREGHGWVLPHVPALLAAGEAFVTEAHADGILVGTWTVDDPEALEQLFGWGIDAVATNDPVTAVAVRERVGGSGSGHDR